MNNLSRNDVHVDKNRVVDSFRSSRNTYEDNAIVQRRISQQLVTLLMTSNTCKYNSVLEVGCCTGLLTDFLCENCEIESLYLNDIVPEFCELTTGRPALCNIRDVSTLPGDIELCSLPGDLDLIISSSTFQWIDDLDALFEKFHRSLKDQGVLAFSLFGPGTMGEVRQLTGKGLQYLSLNTLLQLVRKRFKVIVQKDKVDQLFLPSVRAVMRHIKDTGVAGVGGEKWSHSQFKEFEKRYREEFVTEQGIPVSYFSTTIIAKKEA
ncbi:MAG: malonyl-CoA O-methyltransferase [Desulforhopalus sp.]|jgi:malonyl-CoA O-methyltransferase